MKVLSLIEPYATLIKLGKKKIETRSFKTNYRGELYIHASSTKIPKEWKNNKEVMSLVNDASLNFGYIICKCKLVDCVYMDEEFLDKIKKDKLEYLVGDYKLGRYAWILEDIEVLDKPIFAKGKLGIWNYEEAKYIMEEK
jgi:hypothetical protein